MWPDMTYHTAHTCTHMDMLRLALIFIDTPLNLAELCFRILFDLLQALQFLPHERRDMTDFWGVFKIFA